MRRDVCFSPLKAGIIVFHVRTSLARSHSNFHARPRCQPATRATRNKGEGRKGELREGTGTDDDAIRGAQIIPQRWAKTRFTRGTMARERGREGGRLNHGSVPHQAGKGKQLNRTKDRARHQHEKTILTKEEEITKNHSDTLRFLTEKPASSKRPPIFW